MSTFVNPLPGIPVHKWLCFDYPVGYKTKGTLPNIDLKDTYGAPNPDIEAIYGRLGIPAREQGHPCMREYFPEQEDPKIAPYHDQIVDKDRPAVIDHTGRLSGNFVRYVVQTNHQSLVKMHAVHLTDAGNPILLWESGFKPLTPMANGPNVWYWEDASTRRELLFTAHAVIDSSKWKTLNMEAGIYKLVINWEFWDFKDNKKERMPISGFNDAITFELSEATINL